MADRLPAKVWPTMMQSVRGDPDLASACTLRITRRTSADIRGRAEAIAIGGAGLRPGFGDPFIRIHPEKLLAAVRDVHLLRGLLDQAELVAVKTARAHGKSWTEVATMLHMSPQSAWERWSELDTAG